MAAAQIPRGEAAAPPESMPGELLVKLRPGFSAATAAGALASMGILETRRLSGSMSGLGLYQVQEGVSLEEALDRVKTLPSVQYAQPNYLATNLARPRALAFHGGMGTPPWSACLPKGRCPLLFPSEAPAKPPVLARPPEVSPPMTDPELRQSYGLSLTRSTEAWNLARGQSEVVVAVIDSGIDYNHEDLAFNMWRNPSPSDKQDFVGFDFLRQDGLPYDDDEITGHGTHAAGIIGAVGGNGRGLSGVNQRVSLMALKAFSAFGFGTTESVVAAIGYALDHGAKVISNSWATGKKDNPALIEAIEKAREKGVLFVVAAGNSHGDNDNDDTAAYPAGYHIDNIVAVASVDSGDQLAPSSNYGQTTVLLAAPGVNIYSTLPGGKYGWESGTSMACPFVAGAAALVWSRNPQWTYLQVKKALADSVDKLGQLSGKTITGGRLNTLRALQVQP